MAGNREVPVLSLSMMVQLHAQSLGLVQGNPAHLYQVSIHNKKSQDEAYLPI